MKVAVIGAGAAGLVTVDELRAAGHDATAFEALDEIGGTWIYTDEVESDPSGRAPKRRLSGSMYAGLRTNLPRELMAIPGFAFDGPFAGDPRRFPGHGEVLAYLRAYARAHDLTAHVRLGTTVERIEPAPADAWDVTTTEGTQRFDAVAVCNGHYTEPHVPDLPGLDAFAGALVHAHNYRAPDAFAGRTVVLLGAKSSGQDLARELVGVASRVVLCAREHEGASRTGPNDAIDLRPAIAAAVGPDTLRLTDGTEIGGIDVLLLCTGYRYAFPFVDAAALGPLWLDLLPAQTDTLALLGLPFQVVPFPLFQAQARWFARALSGDASIPDRSARRRWSAAHHRSLDAGGVASRDGLRYGSARQHEVETELRTRAGDAPPPPWRQRLHDAVSSFRRAHMDDYRDTFTDTAGSVADTEGRGSPDSH